MSTETTHQVGGFDGDPAAALNPPGSAGGCCGTPAVTGTEQEPASASTCCGTVAEAQAAGSCCGETAKADAVASGAGCCG